MSMSHRRRQGMTWLLVGCCTFGAALLLAVTTGNWRWLLYAASLFMVSFSLGLILLVQPSPRAGPTLENQKHLADDAQGMPLDKTDAPARRDDGQQ
jgi:hypothetical protein